MLINKPCHSAKIPFVEIIPKAFVVFRRDKAEKLAAGDEIVLKRVAFLRKGLRDAELTVAVRRMQSKFEKSGNPEDKSAFQIAFAELKKYRASVEGDFICNYSAVASKERSGSFWPWGLNRNPAAK